MAYRADNICVNCSIKLKRTKVDFKTLLMCDDCIAMEAYVDWSVKTMESDRDISGDCNRIFCSSDCPDCCIPLIRALFGFNQEFKNSVNLHFDKFSKKLPDTKGF